MRADPQTGSSTLWVHIINLAVLGPQRVGPTSHLKFIHESRDAPSHGGHAPLFSCPLHSFLPPPPLYSRHHHSPALLPSTSPSPKPKLSLRVALWTLHSPRPYSEDTP